jgi:hypothetical protein
MIHAVEAAACHHFAGRERAAAINGEAHGDDARRTARVALVALDPFEDRSFIGVGGYGGGRADDSCAAAGAWRTSV